ncbi:MAG: hypothetical protein Q9172_002455 [Xanthocarpia lactea]
MILKFQRGNSFGGRLRNLSQHAPTKPLARKRSSRTQVFKSAPAQSTSSRRREQTRTRRVLSLPKSSKRRVTRAGRKASPSAGTIFASVALWKRSHNKWETTNHLDEISLEWIQRFARVYNGEAENYSSSASPTSLILEILRGEKTHVTQSWERVVTGLPFPKSRRLWQDVMLWALQHRIDKAVTFLDVTLSDSSMPALRHAVENSLKHIVSVSLQGQVANLQRKNDIHRLLCTFAEASMLRDDRTYSISPKIIYLVLRHSDNHQVRVLYEVLLNARLDVPTLDVLTFTLTHFMDRFTRMGRPDLAMHVLKRIAASGADVSFESVQYSCITLLRTRFGEVDWYKVQSYLVTEMLELGIRPGIPMLNTMILNAVEACDYQTAQAMFETARIHGIRRDTITYSTLLKGALQNRDHSLVGRIMHMAEEDGALPNNNELVFSLIVTMLQIAQLESAVLYRAILNVYSRYCNISPLQELGIYIDTDKHVGTAGTVTEPSSKLLSLMMVSYIRLIGGPDLVQELYNRYRSHVDQNHNLIAPIAETDHLANAFLLGLGRHRATFKICPIILRNMLEPSVTTTVKVAQPTIRTWSIAARTYFFHGQRAAGEKIVEMMRARGIQPSLVTWNTILSGYASLQDASGVVKVMKGMEAAGIEADSYTLKAMARLRNRDRLLNALRKAAANDDNARAQTQESHDPVPVALGLSSDETNESGRKQATAANTRLTDSTELTSPIEHGLHHRPSFGHVDGSSGLDRFRRSLYEHRHEVASWSEQDADGDFLQHL